MNACCLIPDPPALPAPPPVLDRCFFLPKNPPVFIQLGRYGDLILLFPAFLLVYQRTGLRPIVIVSTQYASVFDGISYAIPDVQPGHWFQDMPKARRYAQMTYGDPMIPHWWSPGVEPKDVPRGGMVLQCHGFEWSCDPDKYSDFGTSMWLRAGFTRDEMLTAPLVFDRRDRTREEELVKRYHRPGKKLVLYNCQGNSSPFGYTPELEKVLYQYRSQFNIVDIGRIRCHRLYDLLGLYDIATGLITIDTSTCHLAPAAKVPTIWLTVPGWGKSIPRGNVALHVQYDQVPQRMGEIAKTIESWL